MNIEVPHYLPSLIHAPYLFPDENPHLTKSSKMSLWCTWMVISVSYLVLSTFVKFFVVCSIKTFSSSRKAAFVCCITFLSYLAFVSASVASLVQIIWIPNKPTWHEENRRCQAFSMSSFDYFLFSAHSPKRYELADQLKALHWDIDGQCFFCSPTWRLLRMTI